MHAYVLTTNHVHLLATPKHAGDIPCLMISLGRRYVQYFNKIHRRTGTLWGSRYKSSLILAGLAGKDNSCSEGYDPVTQLSAMARAGTTTSVLD